MSRNLFFSVFSPLFAKFEKERVKQVIAYFAKHAVPLSCCLDFEVSTKFGRQFKKRPLNIVQQLLELYIKKVFDSAYAVEVIQKALSELKQANFEEKHLTDDALDLDCANSVREHKVD